jgi:pimeloyl-ACP methyl ester carboxylesterase
MSNRLMVTGSHFKTEAGAQLILNEYERLLDALPDGAARTTISTSAGETFVVTCGTKAGPPVLLLHGGNVNSSMWLDTVRDLAPHFRVHLIDLPGEPGLSSPTRPSPMTGAFAAWLDEVFHDLGITKASLIGASMGGWLALDYAARHPTRIDRLVVLAPMGVGRVRTSFMLKVLPLMMMGRRGREKALRSIIGPVPAGVAFADRNLLSLIQQHFRGRMDPIPILSDGALSAISAPMLCVVGEQDAIIRTEQTKDRVTAKVAGSTVLSLPDAGHRIFGHAPEILAFLKV